MSHFHARPSQPGMNRVRIGIIGDYDADKRSHRATGVAIIHAADALGVSCESTWMPTKQLEADANRLLERFDGLWCAPGSPYRSLTGALEAVRFAREAQRPFLGTCGGFQHAVLEYARNVLGLEDAAHAEYDPYASNLFVTRLACSLKGRKMHVSVLRDSHAFAAYGVQDVEEEYYCDFGIDSAHQRLLNEGGLRTCGTDQDGEARIVELQNHPHFVATLFVPQVNSERGRPHPLITGFLKAAVSCSESTTERLK